MKTRRHRRPPSGIWERTWGNEQGPGSGGWAALTSMHMKAIGRPTGLQGLHHRSGASTSLRRRRAAEKAGIARAHGRDGRACGGRGMPCAVRRAARHLHQPRPASLRDAGCGSRTRAMPQASPSPDGGCGAHLRLGRCGCRLSREFFAASGRRTRDGLSGTDGARGSHRAMGKRPG